MSHPDYIVIRAAPDLPPGFLPPDWEGRWIEAPRWIWRPPDPSVTAVAVATGRFEIRDDGAVAEVYEVRP